MYWQSLSLHVMKGKKEEGEEGRKEMAEGGRRKGEEGRKFCLY